MANNRRRAAGGGFGFSTSSLTGPGTVFTLAFIALAIGMGVLLTRGFTPADVLTEPENKDTEVELVLETPIPGQRGLQLKTLKFKECGNTVTIDMLLDRSGSMRNITPSGIRKIDRLKEAVLELTSKAKDTSIVGIQSFDSMSITNDVPVSYFKDVKSIIPGKISALSPGQNTPTHDALIYSYNILKEAVPKFPDRKFNFIFISDGAPCPGIDCPGNITPSTPDQDPRLYTPNPADEIKKLGVNVYSLGIYEAGQKNLPFLSDLLKSIASTPSNYYAATSADDTKRLLTQISNKICNEELTPTP
ncbi:MAG: vWA domain-containing protein [Candidatus Levybacteria bacterium]|nr:vWA domain-containing protein [Candidatus Levybacteria bacterium]